MTDRVAAARERVRRLTHVTQLRAALTKQVQAVERELLELDRRYTAEQRDVDKLEGRTLAAAIARLRGQREERLAQERAEADVARLRVDGHRGRLRQLNAEAGQLDRELAELADAPAGYERAMAETEAELVAAGDPRGQELARITVRLADAEADLREHDEAYQAGRRALAAVEAVLGHLGGSRRWSGVDMFTGGFADMFEHQKLEQANQAAWKAQNLLDAFAREMADLGLEVAPKLPPIDTRWFVDVVFDNIITDAIKHDRIARTQEQVGALAGWLHATVGGLAREMKALTTNRDALKAERERLHG
jgi:hypothetical protein